MPISRQLSFKCIACGYTEIRTVGDVLPDINMYKPCPTCGGKMEIAEQSSVADLLGFLDKVIGALRR